ncbi:MAG TPA: flagellar motor protein MotA [Kiloniellales bacterium]
MYRPQRYLVRMVLFLVFVALAVGLLAPRLTDAFLANTLLNGMIIGVLLLGIIYIFRQVVSLNPEIGWLARLKAETSERLIFPESLSTQRPPRLLAPMANMLRERKGRLSLSTTSMRALLDSIGSRIEESHEISRYLIGLLIFLGLLGTFWGLLETVSAVGDTISGLSGGDTDPAVLFQNLKTGLETPLSGMGTAFSSSLFGLAGSLVLGFLELQASQAHNRFVNDLEEWLSSVTRLSPAGPLGEGDHSVPAYIQALLEQTADSLDALQRTFGRSEEDRDSVARNLGALSERLGTLNDQMRTELEVLIRLAEAQSQMQPVLARLSEASPKSSGLDEASRAHLRNLDLRAGQIIQELAKGRDHAVQEIRNEIRLLARTIAAIAEEGE